MCCDTFPVMSWVRHVSLVLMAALYLLAGTMHFLAPDFYLQMMPGYLPFHLPLVYLSGLAEIALGAGLLVPSVRRLAAWGVILLLIAVFPANVHMAIHSIVPVGLPSWMPTPTPAGLYRRLPLQLVLIAWAYLHTRRVD